MSRTAAHEIITVPNGISSLGATYVAKGLHEGLDSPEGAWHVFVGRMLDLVDGQAARALNQSSEFGARFDASLDKLGILAIVAHEINKDILPKPIAAAVITQNAVNTGLTFAAHSKHPKNKLRPTREGKRGMFFQNLSLGLFSLQSVFAKEHPGTSFRADAVNRYFAQEHMILSRISGLAAYTCATTGIISYGAKATNQYYDRAHT
jgi:phosphatidylglycerophosphate synthase